MLFLASEIMEQENGAEEINSHLKKQPIRSPLSIANERFFWLFLTIFTSPSNIWKVKDPVIDRSLHLQKLERWK